MITNLIATQITEKGKSERVRCPACDAIMQLNGKVVQSNAIVKQRYTCKLCRSLGVNPYNYFGNSPICEDGSQLMGHNMTTTHAE